MLDVGGCEVGSCFVFVFFCVFFFKQRTAYEISACLVGSEMCIRGSVGPVHRSVLLAVGVAPRKSWAPCGD